MKHLRIVPILLLTASLATAQVPQGIKYQVVVRDNNGIPVESKSISLRISLLEDSLTGQAGYVETHSTSTNALGLVNLIIGTGDNVLNDMDDLQWGLHEYFAKVEVDTNAGSNYTLLGISQLLTVPYAFHSQSSGTILMNTAQRDALASPWPGMQVYNTDDECMNIYDGTTWINLCGFRCGDLLVDPRDQQQYPTVKIGTQCWMARNLNIGTMVISTTFGSIHSDVGNNGIIEKYCYNNDINFCNTYGGLYDWNEMMGYIETEGVQGICPLGWHIPTDAEWTALENFFGGSSVAGGKLKEAGFFHWTSPNTGATNNSAFTALPGGYRFNFGSFTSIGYYSDFWSSSVNSPTLAWSRLLSYNDQSVFRSILNRANGFSVRCVRD